jgi:4-carboxymuconolactone decarboxylase
VTDNRLPRLLPDELDAAQRRVYDGIAGGDRATGVQHFPLTDAEGALNGPFGVMLHAPGVGLVLQELGSTIRFKTDLAARVREIAILLVARAEGSEFEWWAHERVARAVGLTDAEITALSIGAFVSSDPVESAAAAFCSNLLTSSVVTDEDFASGSRALSNQQMIDLTVLVGYYRMLAQLMNVFAVGVPDER